MAIRERGELLLLPRTLRILLKRRARRTGIQIKRIEYVRLLVSDFELSFRFYTEVLGCMVTNRRKAVGGGNLGHSGSRSFYFNDSDGNRLEIYADMMRVPNGEEFPRYEYAEAMRA